jgi:hypothetical protein
MFRRTWILAFSSLLAGCASTTTTSCPQLQKYSAAEIKTLAAELRAMPKDDPAAKAIVEARNLRRACGAK